MKKNTGLIAVIAVVFIIAFGIGYFSKTILTPETEGVRDSYLKNTAEKSKAEESKEKAKKNREKSRRMNPGKKRKARLDKLKSIGYLSGYKKAGKKKNVTKYIKNKAYNGLNLYVSAHAPEAILMDMRGKVLHKWRYKNPLTQSPEYSYGHFQKRHWRRVHLYENGDLLAIFEGLAMLKLDKDSRLLWKYDEGPHHDIHVTPEGQIYVLTREAKVIPRLNKIDPVLEDSITILSPEGKRLKRVSVLKAFENSNYSPLLQGIKKAGDIFHTNTIEVFDGSHAQCSPLFKKGNALISIRYLNAVAIVDMEKEKVLWCLTGMWREQHQPSLLRNGNMLLFDNNGLGKRSRILEFDPFSQNVNWQYKGKGPKDFYSSSSGSVQRLLNGNTLITESNTGRAFEVTPEGTVVWEFFNPHRSWKNKKLVATLFEVIRLKPGFPAAWASKQSVK
jgi:hypothetical protein